MTSNTISNARSAEAVDIAQDFADISVTYGGNIGDLHEIMRQKRATEPVMNGDILAEFGVPSQADTLLTGRQVYTLFKYADITAVLRDPETYTSGILNEGLGSLFGGFMLTGMVGEVHKLARALLTPVFSPSAINAWKDRIKPVVAQAIAELRPKGRADIIKEVLLPLPVRLIYTIMGYPDDEAQVHLFASRAMRLLGGPRADAEEMRQSMAAAFEASQELYDDTIAIIRQRRAEGSKGDDLIGYLLRASYDGRTLSDQEATEFMRQLLPAAAETTTRSFGSILVALFQKPDLLERLRSNRSLLPKAITEGMRWETAAQFLARLCERDVEIRGVKIPAGAALSLACGSANRDEEVFENPDEFNIDRKMKAALGFGYGAHMCLGMSVARLEMETLLDAMLEGLPNLRLDPDAPPPTIVGAQLRGPRELLMCWDA